MPRSSTTPRRGPSRLLFALVIALGLSGVATALSPALVSAARPPGAGIYGPGVNIDSKANRRVTTGMGVALRFRATTTSRVNAILFAARWGSGYSGGDGGRYRISINKDDRTRNHFPSSKRLTELVWEPGNRISDGQPRRFILDKRPLLRKGRIYHVVFKNIHPNPNSNFFSVNSVFTYETLTPRQPRFRDGIYAVLNASGSYGSGNSWTVEPRHTPTLDIAYANGRHDGLGYLNSVRAHWGAISGDDQVRERFTIKGHDRHVDGACVRVGRQRGRGALTIRLEEAGGGAIVSRTSSAAADVGITRTGEDADNGDWVCVKFPESHVLRKGRTYNLRLTAPSDTQYSMTPLLALDSTADQLGYHLRSWTFGDGRGERSDDGGRSWRSLYSAFPQNTQFYLTLG